VVAAEVTGCGSMMRGELMTKRSQRPSCSASAPPGVSEATSAPAEVPEVVGF
jgi:hypothetical protein